MPWPKMGSGKLPTTKKRNTFRNPKGSGMQMAMQQGPGNYGPAADPGWGTGSMPRIGGGFSRNSQDTDPNNIMANSYKNIQNIVMTSTDPKEAARAQATLVLFHQFMNQLRSVGNGTTGSSGSF